MEAVSGCFSLSGLRLLSDDVGAFTFYIGFDEAELLAPGTGRRYGRSLPVPVLVNSSGCSLGRLVDLVISLARNSSLIAPDFLPKMPISAWK